MMDGGSPEEVATDLSDLSEMERQVVRRLPAGDYYDAEDSAIVRRLPDLPEVRVLRGGGRGVDCRWGGKSARVGGLYD